MNLDDLKPAYRAARQEQVSDSTVEETIQLVRRRAEAFDQTIRRRDLYEIAVCALLIPVFVFFIFVARSIVTQIGCVVVIAACTQIIWVLTGAWRSGTRVPKIEQSVQSFAEDRYVDVTRQIWLLDNILSWYVAPILLGVFIVMIGLVDVSAESTPSLILLGIYVVFCVALGWFLVWLNRRIVVKTLIPLRDQWRIEIADGEPSQRDPNSNFGGSVDGPAPLFPEYEKMKSYNWIAMLLVVALSIGTMLWVRSSTADESRRAEEEFVEVVDSEIARLAMPLIEGGEADALSIGVVSGDKRFQFHAGEIGDDRGKPDDQTLYEIGGVTGLLTNLMLASEVVDGNLSLNDPASVVGSELELPSRNSLPIRWVDLATHRSGLPRMPDNMSPASDDDPYVDYTVANAAEFLRDVQIQAIPGSTDEYSNLGWMVLGNLVAQSSGTSYAEMLQSRVAEPLQMASTRLQNVDFKSPKLATPHRSAGQKVSRWNAGEMPGGGGVISNLADMMQLAEASLHPPEGPIGEAIEVAWEQYGAAIAGGSGRCLGWSVARDGSTRWRNGATGGFRSVIYVNREIDAAVVVLCNTSKAPVEQLGEVLVQRAAGMNVTPMDPKIEVEVPVDQMKRLEGQYELMPNFVLTVTVKNDQLMVDITNQPEQRVYASAPDVWFYKVVNAQLHFDLPETGPAKSLTLHQNGLQQLAPRKE